jgi:O-antigen ligase
VVAWAVILLPLALTAALFPLPHVGAVARILILTSVAPSASCLARGLRRTEVWWAGILLLYLFATFFSALFAADLGEALLDFVRQVYIVSISLLLMLSLRNPVSRAALSYGMVFMVVAGVLEIFVLYVSYAGFSFSSLEDLQAFKYYAVDSLNVPLNPVSFAVVLAFLLAYPALSQRRWIVALTAVLVLAAVVFSGSRTTLLSFLLSSLVIALFVTLRRRALWLRQIVYPVAVPGLVVASVYLMSLSDEFFDPYECSDLTTGRTDLWVAALKKFADSPLVGWGAGSWSVNLAAYLPVHDPWDLEQFTSLEAGAFHNTYLTVLAEKGLIVFIPAMVMAAFLVRQSWRLRVQRALFSGLDANYATVAPLIVVLILVRGLGEHAGWWGYANGGVDYLSYVAASSVVAAAARLDRVSYQKRATKGGKHTRRWI